MMRVTLDIPDDEVGTFVIRRMGEGDYVVTMSHRFGSVYDDHGQIIGPIAPHGVANDPDLPAAVQRAVEDMRREVEKKRLEQNARAAGTYAPMRGPSIDLDLDLTL